MVDSGRTDQSSSSDSVRVRLRVHPSVIVIATIFCVVLAQDVLPELAEGEDDFKYWVFAGIGTVALLSSVVLHELGHAAAARRRGVAVRQVSLWFFGGVAEMDRPPETPEDELVIARSGPLTSVAIAAAAGTVAMVSALVAASPLITATLSWLAMANLVLAGFNLLPAFPLDGGRMYVARLRRRGMDRLAATERAAKMGAGTAVVLAGLGAIELLAGSTIGGVWFLVIAWFVYSAAEVELARLTVSVELEGLTCADVMTPDPVVLPAAMHLDEFVHEVLPKHRHMSYPIVDSKRVAVGLLVVKDLHTQRIEGRPSNGRGSSSTVAEVARPLDRVVTLAPGQPADDLVQLLAMAGEWRALVLDDDQVQGIVSPTDLVAFLAAHHSPRSRDQGQRSSM